MGNSGGVNLYCLTATLDVSRVNGCYSYRSTDFFSFHSCTIEIPREVNFLLDSFVKEISAKI